MEIIGPRKIALGAKRTSGSPILRSQQHSASDSSSAHQEVSCILWNSIVLTVHSPELHESSPHPQNYFLMIHFNITLQCMPRSPNRTLSLEIAN